MQNIYVICDYREKFPSYFTGEKIYNDHISKKSLDNLIDAIQKCGYCVEYFGGIDRLIEYYYNKIPMPDGLYINLNDGLTEKHKRGQTPLLLELLNVHFSGSDVFHTLLASDKFFSNVCLREMNITCPSAVQITDEASLDKIFNLALPVIVKPNYEGSSIGITPHNLCLNYEYALKLCREMLRAFDEIIIEEYISGYEVTNLVIKRKSNGEILLNEPMVISLGNQIFLENEIMGIEEKYKGLRKYWLASQILPSKVVDTIKATSHRISQILHLTNYFRIDYRISGDKIYFIEANTNPAFGMSSDVGKLCKLTGKSFSYFVNLYVSSLFD